MLIPEQQESLIVSTSNPATHANESASKQRNFCTFPIDQAKTRGVTSVELKS